MAAENETQYRVALHAFKELVMGDIKIEVFLTDQEDALINAIAGVFPTTPRLLCMWHINKRMQTKAQKIWKVNTGSDKENQENQEKRKDFMTRWEKASL